MTHSYSDGKNRSPQTGKVYDMQTKLPRSSADTGNSDKLQDLRIPMPMDVLPSRTRAVLEEVKLDKPRAGEEMILATLLSTASFACGTGYSVLNPANLYRPLPTLLSFIISAPSGGGKTTIGDLFREPFSQSVSTVGRDLIAMQDDESPIDAQSAYNSIDPVVSETTATGLAKHMQKGPAYLFNCDGGDMIGGYAAREEATTLAALLCKSWSRESINMKRSDEKNNVYCQAPQLTGLLMAQEMPVRAFYGMPEFKNIGVHARWLPVIAQAKPADERPSFDSELDALFSMQSTAKAASTTPLLAELQKKIRSQTELYMMNRLTEGEFAFSELPIMTWADRDAASEFLQYRIQCEERAHQDDEDSMLKRAPEHALRIASVLAFIETDEMPLDRDETTEVVHTPVLTKELVRAGCVFTDHFMDQLTALTSSRACSPLERDGDELLVWLRDKTEARVDEGSDQYQWKVRTLRQHTARTRHEQSVKDFGPLLRYLNEEGKIKLAEPNERVDSNSVFYVLPWGTES